MQRFAQYLLSLTLVVVFFTSCNNAPDHEKYIPKDAAIVAAIDLQSLGKTIAWNMITGSSLFTDMEKNARGRETSDLIKGIDKSGIDAMNTFYFYIKTDNRYAGGTKITGLIPLKDAVLWEEYAKKIKPGVAIKEQKDFRCAVLGNDMFAGWNKNLLILINVVANAPAGSMAPDMVTEMETAFNVAREDNSIKSNKNFQHLAKAGHDLSLWVNYEQIMNQYMADAMNANPGVSLSPSVWKETAIACGFDFRKGKITGDLAYYMSKEMEETYKHFGNEKVSSDLIARMPAKDLNMMMALHFSPKGTKELLDKTNMTGLVNTGLASEGLDIDKVLDAFTGDMAFSINALSLSGLANAAAPRRAACMSYVMKLNQVQQFEKLVAMGAELGAILPIGKAYVLPLSPTDSMYLVYDKEYAVVSNQLPNAGQILAGSYKNQDGAARGDMKKAHEHPFSVFVDIQQSVKNIDLGTGISPADAALFDESRKLLSGIRVDGGEMRDGAIQAHMAINFTNTSENSLIALLNYGMRVNQKFERTADSTTVEPPL